MNAMLSSVDALDLLVLRLSEKAMPTIEKRRSTVADDAGQPKYCRQGSGEDLVAAQQCYKLSNVHPPTSYEVRGSPLTAPTLAFLPPVLAYCCSRGLLFTIVVHQGYCCSVVTVNNNNTVQKLTFGNSNVRARAPKQPVPGSHWG